MVPVHSRRGLERRHRRWGIRGGIRRARAGADRAEAVRLGIVLVNDVNFLLYTPFLPEAAAGTLEPRHVVTPLRDILRRTYLRLGAVTAHDPGARTVELTNHEDEVEELRYDQFLVALGSVSRLLPVPGLDEHAIGFKSLADAIWLRNHVIETLEAANDDRGPGAARGDAHLRLRRRRLRGLEALAELQDFAVDAMDRYPRARLHGMRWILVEATDRVLPETPADLAAYAVARAPRARDRHPPRHPARGARRREARRLSTGEVIPTRTLVWTTGVTPHPSLRKLEPAAGRAGPRPDRRVPAGPGARCRLGGGRRGRDPRSEGRRHARRLRSTRSARARRAARNIAAELGVGEAAAVHIPGQGLVREPRPLQGGRQARPVQVLGLSPPGGSPAATT